MCQTVKLSQQTDLSGCHHVYLFSQYDPQTIEAFHLVIVCKSLVSTSPHFENQYRPSQLTVPAGPQKHGQIIFGEMAGTKLGNPYEPLWSSVLTK